MLVSSIVIKWAPAPVPGTGSNIDWMKASGQLLKSGSVVAELPEVTFTIEAGPGASRPSELSPWAIEQPVYADTLVLSLYDSEWEHTVVIDSVEAVLSDVRHAEWAAYTISLPTGIQENYPA